MGKKDASEYSQKTIRSIESAIATGTIILSARDAQGILRVAGVGCLVHPELPADLAGRSKGKREFVLGGCSSRSQRLWEISESFWLAFQWVVATVSSGVPKVMLGSVGCSIASTQVGTRKV